MYTFQASGIFDSCLLMRFQVCLVTDVVLTRVDLYLSP